jgi:hypothetical protein
VMPCSAGFALFFQWPLWSSSITFPAIWAAQSGAYCPPPRHAGAEPTTP